jgi:cytochrome c556
MKLISKACLLVIGITLSATAYSARDPLINAIKARQGQMQLRQFNLGPLFGMAKGKIDYDAEMANKLAGNLKLMLDLDNGRAWAQGSDNENYAGKTRALPEAWTTYPEIDDYDKKYVMAVNEMAAVAGDGRDALKSKLGAVGKACKGCHDEFREEE